MKGVTLIELLIVLLIIGIISALVTVDTSWWIRETRLTEARDTMLADIENAKLRSITGRPHAVFFFMPSAPALNRYELHQLTDTNGDFIPDPNDTTEPKPNLGVAEVKGYNCQSPYTTITPGIAGNDAYCFPQDYKISLSNCTTNNRLWFDRKGIPRCSGWGLGMATITLFRDTNANNTLDSGELSKTIIIDTVGKIKYEQ